MTAAAPEEVVIVAAARTPFGRFRGALAARSATDLGTVAAGAAIERSGLAAADVDAVLLGQVLQAGAGQNPSRQAAMGAGVPPTTPAVTLNKVCLSGLAAVIDGARLLRVGEAGVVLAGGQESMTNAPHLLAGVRLGLGYGDVTLVDAIARDGLTDAFDGRSMGLATDKQGRDAYHVSRERQDDIAAASHQRAAAAAAAGLFDAELAPVSIPGGKGDPVVVAADEGIRADTTSERLGRLRPAFSAEGTITAGNASQVSDGAAAVVLTTRARAEAAGAPILATVRAHGQVAGPDTSLHAQPARAIALALSRQGWAAGDLDLVETNEAFAMVVAVSTDLLGVDRDRVNVHGGGISLGHPIGASGARLVTHVAHELRRRGGGRAAVALCGGGGQGEALLLEA